MFEIVLNIILQLIRHQVFRNNFVHGDLHPGNLLVRGLDRCSLQELPNSEVQVRIYLIKALNKITKSNIHLFD